MRVIPLIVIPAILLLVFGLAVSWLPLPHPFPPAGSNARNLIAAALTGILGFGYLAGLAVYLVVWLSRVTRALDPLLTSRGLEAGGSAILGREYHGQIEGCQVDVHFTPPAGTQRGLLQVYFAAQVDTCAAFGVEKPLLDCGDCELIELHPLELRHLQVLAQDPAWVHSWVADPTVCEALARLMGDHQALGLRELYLQPGKVWLRARPTAQVGAAHVGQWLDALLTLARTAA